MVEDRLRHFPNWLASRNLANEASDESVQALVEAVRARYEVPRRWYRLKAQLLGVDKLADYDRLAPVSDDDEHVGWSEARDLVLDSYGSFSGELGDLAKRFFDERWIDAPVRPNKRGGAFCAYTVPSAHPYVLLNYTYKRRDVMTLAHELGHGVHAALGARQGVFHMSTPLTLAETASVFGEQIVFGRLLELAETPESRLVAADGGHGRRGRHRVPPDRHEPLRAPRAHGAPRGGRAGRRALLRAVAGVPERAARRRGRADGQLRLLVVLRPALHRLAGLRVRVRLRPAARARRLRPLRGGGRRVRPRLPRAAGRRRLALPEELGQIVGVDLADPGFWDRGLAIVDRQLEAAENAAREAGRL